VIPIWVLYVALSVAYFLIGSALLLATVPPLVRAYHEWRWRRFKARRGGDILQWTEERRYMDWVD
jgi:uncharacterized membrane protein